jgi:hypothetical protein
MRLGEHMFFASRKLSAAATTIQEDEMRVF